MRPDSVLVGLIGAGIQASLSPAMHMEEGTAQGLPYEYRLIDLDVLGLGTSDLPAILEDAERAGFSGLNVTYPCKQAIIAHLDELSPDANAIGAVNTVLLRNGRRIGHNTDWTGFAEGFRRGLGDARRDRVAQFGAGGAGAAVAHALLRLDVGNSRSSIRIVSAPLNSLPRCARASGPGALSRQTGRWMQWKSLTASSMRPRSE